MDPNGRYTLEISREFRLTTRTIWLRSPLYNFFNYLHAHFAIHAAARFTLCASYSVP